MIAASEPLEFIPRGRQAVTEHPGPLVSKKSLNFPTEHLLLHRLKNVNLSSDDSSSEFWCIRSSEECSTNTGLSDGPKLCEFNSCDSSTGIEHELYVKGSTAVWTRGINVGNYNLPTTCFTCDSPIRYAFFCPRTFFECENPDKRAIIDQNKSVNVNYTDEDKIADFGVCLIDANAMRVYSPCGEDYRTALEFPLSNVWQTKDGLLLERNASSTVIENQSIAMPRLFSLTHPLNELCPVLLKTANGSVNLFTESYIKVAFSIRENDLVMLYDETGTRHLLYRLRKATQEEKQKVGGCYENDTMNSHFDISNSSGIYNFSYGSSLKVDVGSDNRRNSFNRSGFGLNVSNNTSKFHNLTANSPLLHPQVGASPKSQMQSPYDRLQSSSGLLGQTMYSEIIQKQGQAKPSKPIVPEMCLEYVWAENVGNREFPEMASHGFMHVDLIGQTYICYMLPKNGYLMLARLEKSNSSDNPILSVFSKIQAKDAICLNNLKLIAVLAPCGSLIVYTGPTIIAKVHIGGILGHRQPNTLQLPSNLTFPRRSSLLPTVQTEGSFDDDVHLLSPVYPLQPQFPTRTSTICCGLRDAAGSRVTLVYPGNSMYRISIPTLSESLLVTRCLIVLRQVLKKEIAISVLAKWYATRNAPGSQDISSEREWCYFQNFIFQLLGQPMVSNSIFSSQINSSLLSSPTSEPNKRRKTDECLGSREDFEFLRTHLRKARNLRVTVPNPKESISMPRIDSNALLFPHIPRIFTSFHLLYEEMKIDISLNSQRGRMAEFLNQIALDFQLHSYCLHYFLDFVDLIQMTPSTTISDSDRRKLQNPKCFLENVPNVFKTLNAWLDQDRKCVDQFPYIPNVNPMSKNVIELTALIANRNHIVSTYTFHSSQSNQRSQIVKKGDFETAMFEIELSHTILNKLLEMKWTRNDISRLPPVLHYLLAGVLEVCRIETPIDCDSKAFELLLRPELYSNTIPDEIKEIRSYNNFKSESSLSPMVPPNSEPTTNESPSNDGMTHINTKLLHLRFPKDLRVDEVRRLLTSANPVIIDITQKVGVSDHDFIEEKEKQLLAICTRTMALPIGRGMVTLRTSTPAATESLIIPKLCLSGKEKEKGGTIELQQIEVPPNMNVWPMFHNGVAAGLQLTPDCKDVDSTWIVYNKPKSQIEGSTEHAGFLMALGLNGHLKTLSCRSMHEYLIKCDEMTGLGLLLGISAANRGTMDTTTTKLLSIHIEALLPATALELDIPQSIQIAAIMGIGLLYQETAKRHIAEVLLQEIGRPPGPEMENCVERESYALTAGLALGLVTLGKGESPPGLKDLQLPDILHYYMIGGNKRPFTGSQKEKYKLQSFQVHEGDLVNIDVTAPGATLALGLMFFNTGNKSVASWMNPPDTNYLLDLVRPDLLLLRVVARGLILWDSILPTKKWLDSQFPSSLAFDLRKGPKNAEDTEIDDEAICQAYCNITAGAALCIALRFAGTEDKEAIATLEETFNLFLNMNGLYVGEYAGKSTVESCLMLILISMSMVNAGTGDVNILRICRMLRNRLGPTNSHVTYGSHMAIHMAVGFQFLGAGRFTLSHSPQAVAALVCALFPKFPTHSNDNRYHLQAFRHLYVLAVEPRIVLPRDIDSGKLCLCNVTYVTLDGKTVSKMAPCMLPELNSLASLRFEDTNYWPIKFEREKNWKQLERILRKCTCIDIKQKAGCLSHLDDPTHLRSSLAQTLTTEQFSCWRIHPSNLMKFSNDAKVQNFISKFIPNDDSMQMQSGEEHRTSHLLTLQFYHCLIKDTLHGLYIYLDFLMSLSKIQTTPDSNDIWNLKIVSTILRRKQPDLLLSTEYLSALIGSANTFMEKQLNKYNVFLRQYLRSQNTLVFKEIDSDTKTLRSIAAVIMFFGLPHNLFQDLGIENETIPMNLLKFFITLERSNIKLDLEACHSITNLLTRNYSAS